jgi:hypothetical protein
MYDETFDESVGSVSGGVLEIGYCVKDSDKFIGSGPEVVECFSFVV